MSSFSQIRSQSLMLEKQTDQLLTKYSNYEKKLVNEENEAEEIELYDSLTQTFNKREQLINKLNTINEFESNLSTSKLQQLTRHKEILVDHRQIFQRIYNNIIEKKNKNNLLYSIRSDLDNHKQQQQRNDQGGLSRLDDNGYILDESVRVDSFNSFANRLLQSAYETRDELVNQRNYLNNAQLRITSTIQRIPGVNILISKINTRRKRDTVILACVIAFCIIFLFFV